jgi:hypothetical protein
MQQRCKHAFPTTERLCFLRGPCKVVIKKGSVEKSQLSEAERVQFIWVRCCQELGRVLEMAVEGDCLEMARNELDCVKKTSYVLQLQWDWYKYCVKIRCQDTTSDDWEL